MYNHILCGTYSIYIPYFTWLFVHGEYQRKNYTMLVMILLIKSQRIIDNTEWKRTRKKAYIGYVKFCFQILQGIYFTHWGFELRSTPRSVQFIYIVNTQQYTLPALGFGKNKITGNSANRFQMRFPKPSIDKRLKHWF